MKPWAKPYLFRCSSLGKLMTEPKSKSEGVLSAGAKTYIRELAAQEIFGVDFQVSSKAMEKGILCEQDSIDLLNRVRQPFNVNSAAQAAAVAALGDEDFLARSYALNLSGLQQLTEAFEVLGLEYVPSYGNFVLVKVGPAARVYQELLKRGVIVRPVANDQLPEWLRVSIGLPQEYQRFLDALPDALAAARS